MGVSDRPLTSLCSTIVNVALSPDEPASQVTRSRPVVLLKGSDTVVAEPAGRASVTENAPPWLATAGSGDVLAGVTAAALARGVPAERAAAIAVVLHGAAGRVVAREHPGSLAGDLVDALDRARAELHAAVDALPQWRSG